MNRRRINVLAILAVAAVLTLLAPLRLTRAVEGEMADGISPLARLGERVRGTILGITPGHRARVADVPRDRERLEAELRLLRSQKARMEELQAQNERLLSLLDFRRQVPFDIVGARVIGRDSVQWWQTILVDAGADQGVGPRMPVLADGGLLGMTTEDMGSRTARVLLLVDPNSRAGAMVSRSRAYGLLEGMDQRGRLRPTCRLVYVSRHRDIRIGDTVVTSGLGGVYPTGVPIGAVSAVRMSRDELYQILDVELYADAERATEVLVVRSGDHPWLP